MSGYKFKRLELSSWEQTRNKLQLLSQLLSDIKGKYAPHNKNWEEYSLQISGKGLTTGAFPVMVDNDIEVLELSLNFNEHKLNISLGKVRLSVELKNHTVKEFAGEVKDILNQLGVGYELPEDKFIDESNVDYDEPKVEDYWNTLKQVYFILLEFRGSLFDETSSINFWPHHFDIAMLLFSGKLIPDQNPNDWDYSREQMNFGFSTGDGGIPEPYFYITAYQFPENALEEKLPEGSYWQTDGWKGAVIKYEKLVGIENPDVKLLELFKTVKEFVYKHR